MYTDSYFSMQSIEFNNENYPIINLIYDMLAELKNQKSISHCERSIWEWSVMRLQQKKATGMVWMTKTGLPRYTSKGSGKRVLIRYTISKSGKAPTAIGSMKQIMG